MVFTEKANLAARRYAPKIGSELIQQFPDRIPELFRALHTLEQIIYALAIQDVYPHSSLKTLINAVNYALQGYDGQDPVVGNMSFDGLMNPEEVARIHKTLKIAAGKRMGGIRWKETEQSWSQEETEYLRGLKRNPEFMRATHRKNGSFDYAKIAKELNDKFHRGMPIRTSQTVQIKIYRI